MPPLTAKTLPKIGKKREKSGEKKEKRGKKRQKSGSSFTLPLLTDTAGYAILLGGGSGENLPKKQNKTTTKKQTNKQKQNKTKNQSPF